MILKKILDACFHKWWAPIVVLFCAGILLAASLLKPVNGLQMPALIALGITVLILLMSLIYQLWYRRWKYAIISFLFLAASIGAGIFAVIFVFVASVMGPDTYADNLIIPKDIPISIPADLDYNSKRPDSISNRIHTDFQLYNSFQPGLYEYDFWCGKTDSGTIYLKAFEITHNDPLSADRLPERSSINIFNQSDTIMKYGTTNFFIIYEGDWGKPYAARFEVWFKPAKGGTEKKLFEKNYQIEGWMR